MSRAEMTMSADDSPRPNLVRVPRLLRTLLGVRERLVVGGVRYREMTQEPLRRALSKRGSGYKDYAARFPAGRRMRIRVTPSRTYEDLCGPMLLEEYRRFEELIRPGSRALVVRGGTGYCAAWVAERVGPSGAAVSIDDDAESVRYARWRYPLPNVAFEQSAPGRIEAELAGETDGGFDAVLAVNALRPRDDAPALLRELWRVTAAGGWLGLTAPGAGSQWADPRDAMSPRVVTRARLEELLREGGLLGDPSVGDENEGESLKLAWLGTAPNNHALAIPKMGSHGDGRKEGRGRSRSGDEDDGEQVPDDEE